MGLFDLISKKERKRRTLSRNVARGKAGERQAVAMDSLIYGWSSKRTGKGSDYQQKRRSILTGKKQERLAEVKTGKAKLSKLQKKTKPVVRRVNPFPPF
jgi:hypothetical protein